MKFMSLRVLVAAQLVLFAAACQTTGGTDSSHQAYADCVYQQFNNNYAPNAAIEPTLDKALDMCEQAAFEYGKQLSADVGIRYSFADHNSKLYFAPIARKEMREYMLGYIKSNLTL